MCKTETGKKIKNKSTYQYCIAKRSTMTTLRPFAIEDLFLFNNVNLDILTETYHQPFYLQYLAQWPEYFQAQEGPDGKLMGYVMGKAEGKGKEWHGHVTAVTVAPEYRRLGLAKRMMQDLETVSESFHNGYFVDLFAVFGRFTCIPIF